MTIQMQLGYTSSLSLEPVLDTMRTAKANDILLQLQAIDQAIAAATLDSMAVEVGSLKVDYARHLSLLKTEGSRLLKDLANVSGLSVAYDRFSGGAAGVSSTPVSWVSYWWVKNF